MHNTENGQDKREGKRTMIITMKKDAPDIEIGHVLRAITAQGLSVTEIEGTNFNVYGVVGNTTVLDEQQIAASPVWGPIFTFTPVQLCWLLIGYGANADRYETWLPNLFPTKDSQQPFPPTQSPSDPSSRNKDIGYFVSGQVPGDQAVHTATDIPLSAYGAGATQFHGVIDNTEVFFKLASAALAQ